MNGKKTHYVKRLGQEIDLCVEGKVPCPRCRKKGEDRAGNNFHVYGLDSDGEHRGGYCWACEYTVVSEELLREMRENGEEEDEEEYEIVGSPYTKEIRKKVRESTSMDPRGYRGIRKDVSELYRVRYQFSSETGEVEKTLYPTTEDYKQVGWKVRSHPKDFASPGPIGETGKTCELFGQFLFKTHNSMCIITGGEHDALAAFQIMEDAKKDDRYDSMAVVSSTVGEPAAHKQVKAQYEFFNQFKKIIVCMDSDEAGMIAAEKICQVLPRGKASVMKMRLKDPNKYIDEKAERDFVRDFWAAKPYTPAGIHGSSTLYEAAIAYSDIKQLSLPSFLKKVEAMFDGGFVKNELTCIFAETSVGKSIFVDSTCVHWILHEPEEVVGVLSLEAVKEKWSTNILSNFLGVKLIKLKGEARKEYLRQPHIKEKIDPFLMNEDGSDRFYVMDERGAEIDVVKEKILEMIIQLGITTMIVDVYSDLLDGLPLDAQEALVGWLKKLLKAYPQLTIIMVCHTRKRTSGGSGGLTESDIMGTSTVMKSAAQTISLERNKLAELPFLRNCTFVTVHKNRHFSETGPAGIVYYEPSTGQLWDLDEYLETHPEMRGEAEEALEHLAD